MLLLFAAELRGDIVFVVEEDEEVPTSTQRPSESEEGAVGGL